LKNRITTSLTEKHIEYLNHMKLLSRLPIDAHQKEKIFKKKVTHQATNPHKSLT